MILGVLLKMMIISDSVTNYYLFIQNYRLEIIVTEDLNNDWM